MNAHPRTAVGLLSRRRRRIPWFVRSAAAAFTVTLVLQALLGHFIVRVFALITKGSGMLRDLPGGGQARWADPDYYNLVTMWHRFDSGHYRFLTAHPFFAPLTPAEHHVVAVHAVGEWSTSLVRFVFAPLYPLLCKLVLPLTLGHIQVAMVLVAWAAGFGALCYVGLLARSLYGVRAGVNAIWLLAFAPTGFFLRSCLTEPLFLMLMLACCYHARRRQWLLVGILGVLLGLSRSNGFVMAICLGVILLGQRRWRFDLPSLRYYLPRLAAVAAPGLGWALYLGYCKLMTGDALTYVHLQNEWHFKSYSPWEMFGFAWDAKGPVEGMAASQDLAIIAGTVLVLGVVTLWKVPLAEGLSTFLLMVIPLSAHHVWRSLLRYVFPLFALVLFFAWLSARYRRLFPILLGLSAAAQGLCFTLWALDWTYLII